MTWDNATAWCSNTHGRYLASIHTDSQNTAASAVCGNNACWMGSRCYDSACTDWLWQDGSNWSYTNWNTVSGEPNNVDEECVEMYSTGYWNDNMCSTHIALPLCGSEGTETLLYCLSEKIILVKCLQTHLYPLSPNTCTFAKSIKRPVDAAVTEPVGRSICIANFCANE